jgi:hypothetical protein
MERVPVSRVGNTLILVAIIAGGMMTNCEDCGDTTVTGVQPVQPSDATSMPVPGCVSTPQQSYYTASSLKAPDACGGIINGAEITINNNRIGLCPANVAVPRSQSFQIYWTLCNTAAVRNDAAHGATQKSYNLKITTRQGGHESDLTSLPFTQPILNPCECATQTVVFNSASDADPNKKLNPGAYAFFLTDPYAQAKSNRVDVAE